ncbi:MAG TPA: DNA mismatch repair protein MutS, partial [Clostridiales bacterium]|nr:DNA mismatch repair protein MutS [Clostridiales bacterium]
GFIDEILRGTNTIERIAASSAVLDAIARRNALCMAATHDIELTRLLRDVFQNLHFSETMDEDGIRFDYLLREGPTRTRNAIRLLQQMGYGQEIIAAAQDNARRFEQTGSWDRL